MFEFRDRNWGTVCYVKLWNNYTICKPQSACNKQTKKKGTEWNNKTGTAPTQKLTIDQNGRHV